MIKSLLSLYSWQYPRALIYLLQTSDFKTVYYLRRYWQTSNFTAIIRHKVLVYGPQTRKLLFYVRLGMLVQVIVGLFVVWRWWADGLSGGWQFGLAIILAYPIVWAHFLALGVAMRWLLRPKALGRAIICRILEAQVKRLRSRHAFSVVGVVGSIGKTSTKIAVARVLQSSRRVMWQEGNYNDRVTVPLIFFGHAQPHIFNVAAWIRIFIKNEQMIAGAYPYQVVVAELGTDGPGQIMQFAYIKPELVIVTAVTPEHMEYFGTLDSVAREELSALHFAKQALVNIDDTPGDYLVDRNYIGYGFSATAPYRVKERQAKGMHGQKVTFALADAGNFSFNLPLLGEQGAKIALAAGAAAHMLGLEDSDIQKGLADITAFAGRMQILHGIKDSTIIDDTYNASPVAAKAALDVLQSGEAAQRIAILGSMNELGSYSPQAHREVAEHCDPTKLDWVIALGPDAKQYLAPVAKERGCQVKSFLDPYKAGRFVKKELKEGAVVLAKGSQNRVFAEEAIKVLLSDKTDEAKLVRQSDYWMSVKKRQFRP
ncbi:MAG TPA: Mur ligase family protein [Candidatus Saccharimonadales bacterium]|nr:Mur ligase family protein [Candidatus Saccharimonadales bacterium]